MQNRATCSCHVSSLSLASCRCIDLQLPFFNDLVPPFLSFKKLYADRVTIHASLRKLKTEPIQFEVHGGEVVMACQTLEQAGDVALHKWLLAASGFERPADFDIVGGKLEGSALDDVGDIEAETMARMSKKERAAYKKRAEAIEKRREKSMKRQRGLGEKIVDGFSYKFVDCKFTMEVPMPDGGEPIRIVAHVGEAISYMCNSRWDAVTLDEARQFTKGLSSILLHRLYTSKTLDVRMVLPWYPTAISLLSGSMEIRQIRKSTRVGMYTLAHRFLVDIPKICIALSPEDLSAVVKALDWVAHSFSSSVLDMNERLEAFKALKDVSSETKRKEEEAGAHGVQVPSGEPGKVGQQGVPSTGDGVEEEYSSKHGSKRGWKKVKAMFKRRKEKIAVDDSVVVQDADIALLEQRAETHGTARGVEEEQVAVVESERTEVDEKDERSEENALREAVRAMGTVAEAEEREMIDRLLAADDGEDVVLQKQRSSSSQLIDTVEDAVAAIRACRPGAVVRIHEFQFVAYSHDVDTLLGLSHERAPSQARIAKEMEHPVLKLKPDELIFAFVANEMSAVVDLNAPTSDDIAVAVDNHVRAQVAIGDMSVTDLTGDRSHHPGFTQIISRRHGSRDGTLQEDPFIEMDISVYSLIKSLSFNRLRVAVDACRRKQRLAMVNDPALVGESDAGEPLCRQSVRLSMRSPIVMLHIPFVLGTVGAFVGPALDVPLMMAQAAGGSVVATGARLLDRALDKQLALSMNIVDSTYVLPPFSGHAGTVEIASHVLSIRMKAMTLRTVGKGFTILDGPEGVGRDVEGRVSYLTGDAFPSTVYDTSSASGRHRAASRIDSMQFMDVECVDCALWLAPSADSPAICIMEPAGVNVLTGVRDVLSRQGRTASPIPLLDINLRLDTVKMEMVRSQFVYCLTVIAQKLSPEGVKRTVYRSEPVPWLVNLQVGEVFIKLVDDRSGSQRDVACILVHQPCIVAENGLVKRVIKGVVSDIEVWCPKTGRNPCGKWVSNVAASRAHQAALVNCISGSDEEKTLRNTRVKAVYYDGDVGNDYSPLMIARGINSAICTMPPPADGATIFGQGAGGLDAQGRSVGIDISAGASNVLEGNGVCAFRVEMLRPQPRCAEDLLMHRAFSPLQMNVNCGGDEPLCFHVGESYVSTGEAGDKDSEHEQVGGIFAQEAHAASLMSIWAAVIDGNITINFEHVASLLLFVSLADDIDMFGAQEVAVRSTFEHVGEGDDRSALLPCAIRSCLETEMVRTSCRHSYPRWVNFSPWTVFRPSKEDAGTSARKGEEVVRAEEGDALRRHESDIISSLSAKYPFVSDKALAAFRELMAVNRGSMIINLLLHDCSLKAVEGDDVDDCVPIYVDRMLISKRMLCPVASQMAFLVSARHMRIGLYFAVQGNDGHRSFPLMDELDVDMSIIRFREPMERKWRYDAMIHVPSVRIVICPDYIPMLASLSEHHIGHIRKAMAKATRIRQRLSERRGMYRIADLLDETHRAMYHRQLSVFKHSELLHPRLAGETIVGRDDTFAIYKGSDQRVQWESTDVIVRAGVTVGYMSMQLAGIIRSGEQRSPAAPVPTAGDIEDAGGDDSPNHAGVNLVLSMSDLEEADEFEVELSFVPLCSIAIRRIAVGLVAAKRHVWNMIDVGDIVLTRPVDDDNDPFGCIFSARDNRDDYSRSFERQGVQCESLHQNDTMADIVADNLCKLARWNGVESAAMPCIDKRLPLFGAWPFSFVQRKGFRLVCGA